ncbi:MAG: pyridoxal phosphate-dependent aminotransferase [Parvularcula sp.]|jgi:aspartate aminotransferase|nr:pyridoxal phosphate-dependent aminotransferase [Parvularcula sp.]
MQNLTLSDALSRVAPSPTIAVSDKARRLKAEGRDVIALAAGEPDFATPEHIAEAGIKAIKDGKTGYTAVDGIPELKAAVARKFERDNGLRYDPSSEIVVTSGGKFVIYAAMMATLNAGDEVLIPAPYWVSYPDIVKLAGGKPVIVPTRPEHGFRLEGQALAEAITPQTRWLILNYPSNPSGAVLFREALEEIAEVLRAHPQVWVLSDDIYEHVVYDAAFHTLAEVAPDLKDRVLTMNGASKAYSMTGWRIGYAGGPKPLLDGMRKLLSQSTSNPCSISQWAAAAALDGPHDFLAERNAAFRARRDRMIEVFEKAGGFSIDRPEGAFYLYPSCAGLIGGRFGGRVLATDMDVAEALLDDSLVALVPGTAFGLSPYLRLSYAASMDELEEAGRRITAFAAKVERS